MMRWFLYLNPDHRIGFILAAVVHTILVLVASLGVVILLRWRCKRLSILHRGLVATIIIAGLWLVWRGLRQGVMDSALIAASHGDAESVKALLRDGADPNAEGGSGQVPLTYAEGEHHQEIVDMLKRAGAK
jgi:ABC-type nickel/cobalt efflux system permease component RcnA